MALYVNTNVSSINAQRKLTNATNSLNTNYQRLAIQTANLVLANKQPIIIAIIDNFEY